MTAKIKWPKSNKPVKTSNGQFVAFGRTKGTIAGLSWTCTSVEDPTAEIPSELVTPVPVEQGAQQRWAIGFRVPEPGQYRLEVVGEDGHPDSVTFDVGFNHGLTISWPDDKENITDFADDFAPYGTLIEKNIGDVTLEDEDENPVDLLVPPWGDPEVLELWVAQFEALPRGHTYALHAEDEDGDGEDRTGLIVDP